MHRLCPKVMHQHHYCGRVYIACAVPCAYVYPECEVITWDASLDSGFQPRGTHASPRRNEMRRHSWRSMISSPWNEMAAKVIALRHVYIDHCLCIMLLQYAACSRMYRQNLWNLTASGQKMHPKPLFIGKSGTANQVLYMTLTNYPESSLLPRRLNLRSDCTLT